MENNNILEQLAGALGPKNKDGSYNQLIKPMDNQMYTPEAEVKIIKNSFRDEKRAIIRKQSERYSVRTGEDGMWIPENINEILEKAYLNSASDIHISAGAPPKMRVHGELLQMPYEILTPSTTKKLLSVLMTREQIEVFEKDGDLDFAYALEDACRFRVNMFKQRGSWSAVFRTLSNTIPDADSLGISKEVQDLTSKKRGLVLVTGPTGSGKSTTLASLIKMINETRRENIITLEDPIEYLHNHKLSTVAQREMGLDSKSFAASLRAALREDPDVILVGEMRDYETIATAVTAAETGHLVFSTLHTIGAAATIDRIIDSFPEAQQNQIRTQLSNILEAVISQQLIPNATEDGRVAAFEVMFANHAIRNLIREGKAAQMNSTIQTNKASGMITMDDSIMSLYYMGKITAEKAVEYAVDKNSMAQKVGL